MELISVHVPKTAGVTFRKVLLQIYGTSAVHFDYEDGPLDPQSAFQERPREWIAESRARIARLPAEIRVIHGHFGGAKYDESFPGARKIVWVREPLARLVSHYYYWRKLPPTPHPLHRRVLEENLSLLEFARLGAMRNILARVFLRDCDLAAFSFIGVQEHFPAELAALAHQLGWPANVSFGEENKNADISYRSDELAEDLRAEIAELNADDLKIYAQALALRAERL